MKENGPHTFFSSDHPKLESLSLLGQQSSAFIGLDSPSSFFFFFLAWHYWLREA
jgi:hypothetical protein